MRSVLTQPQLVIPEIAELMIILCIHMVRTSVKRSRRRMLSGHVPIHLHAETASLSELVASVAGIMVEAGRLISVTSGLLN